MLQKQQKKKKRLFKDSKEASEDPRFLEIWLKYAKMSSTPVEVYKYMYNAGICTQQAGLYDAWAWFLESQGSCYEVANSVYSKVGLKTKLKVFKV